MNRDKGQAMREAQTKASRNIVARERDLQGAAVYHPAVQDSRMTIDMFVETKFVPEHVAYKTLAGQTHYHAILKHVLTPERVNQIFDPRNAASGRLRSVPQWPYLDGVRLCDFTVDHVRRIIAASRAAEYASQTVKHIKNVLFAIISHAQKEGCFSGVNPAARVKLPRIIRKSPPALTMQQSMALLEHLESPEKEAALFAITTGMTLVELCQLRWQDMNLSGSDRHAGGELIPAWSIAVRSSWNRDGLGDGRTGTRNRNIEIGEPLLSVLKQMKERDSNARDDGFVLASEVGGPIGPISPSSIRLTRLKQAGRTLGIPWVNWQVLRRTNILLPPYVTRALFRQPAPISTRESGKDARQQVVPELRTQTGMNPDDTKTRRAFYSGNRFRGH